MNILTGDNIRKADLATMEREPISGYMLMERASERLAAEILRRIDSCRYRRILTVCGKGNNAGDGFAVARLLSESFRSRKAGSGKAPEICVMPFFGPEEMTPDCRKNFGCLPAEIRIVPSDALDMPGWDGGLIIDAVLGTGVRGIVRGRAAEAIGFINRLRRNAPGGSTEVVSIDLPSGLPTEPEQEDLPESGAVCADETLTIEFPKLSLLYPSTGSFGGRTTVVPIGLDRQFMEENGCGAEWTDESEVRRMFPRRNSFAHKGCYGHALIVAGSEGMTGAAILATGAALKSGCGLVTAHIPYGERLAMHISHPSAMVSAYPGKYLTSLPDNISRFTAIGAGPGLEQNPETAAALELLMQCGIPMVLDADALNIIASRPHLFRLIPAGSVLTPHIGELRRLLNAAAKAGVAGNAEEMQGNGNPWRNEMYKTVLVRELASATGAVIVVKGAHTMVCTPAGKLRFNMTGNPGMAKGGSGDVLAGLITGLMARGLNAADAAVAGVHIHGRAGDTAAALQGEESMDSSDILKAIRI